MKRAAGHLAAATLAVALVFIACDPIVGTPPPAVPTNECPAHFCEAYSQDGAKPQCSAGRCEAGKPTYPYLLVVDVPTTSFFAAGRAFVLDSRVFVGAKGTPRCPSLTCLQLPALATVQTSLSVDAPSAAALGLPSQSSALAAAATTSFILLPADTTEKRFAADIGIPVTDFMSGLAAVTSGVPPSAAELAPGRYARVVVPGSDAVPPIVSSLDRLASEDILIGAASYSLDEPPGGKTRLAHITRTGGLTGFRVWLEDAVTGTRISTVHTLDGEEAFARLDTVDQNDGSVLRANVDIVVAPPALAVGLPTLVNGILQGVGFDRPYPALPPPASVRGTLVAPGGGAVSGDVVFDSEEIALVAPDKPVSFLRYRTTVSSDAAGVFATVLPPGAYSVTVLPSAAAGLSRLRASVTVTGDAELAPLVVRPLSRVTGRALLTDGRALAGAEVVAVPSVVQPDVPDAVRRLRPWLFPREARTTTSADGSFTIVAEDGTYDFVVTPQPGTGFGRAVSPSRKVSPAATATTSADGGADAGATGNDLGTLLVPAPLKLAFSIVDPSNNPVTQAVVRALTLPVGHKEYVEIGSAMTDAQGQFEMLLGPVPR